MIYMYAIYILIYMDTNIHGSVIPLVQTRKLPKSLQHKKKFK